MRIRSWAVLAALAVSFEAAAQCAGFNDVSSASAFCDNLQWVKNRSITTGCTPPTDFCPGDPVSRLQMTAFINRLGTAVTPTLIKQDQSTGAMDLDGFRNNPSSNFCQTAPYTVTGFPRQAVVNGHWTGLPAGFASVFTVLTVSNNGTFFSDLAPYGMRDTANGTWVQTAQSYTVSMTVGQTYIFAIGVERAIEDFGTVDLSQSRCTLVATIHNRNGTSPPFDEPPRGPPDNR